MIDLLLRAGKTTIIAAVAGLVVVIAITDWAVGNTFSLGVLYILPMILGALMLRWPETAALALLCAFLRSRFDVPSTLVEAALRFVFASVSYFVSSLFVIALMRNRRLVTEHLAKIQREQERRVEAEEQLRVLVASSPAGILTLDWQGVVLAANDAVNSLFAIPPGETLVGRVIVSYLPVLSDALGLETGQEGFRTAAQCQGRKVNGEIFQAHTWFSSYSSRKGTRLAAIIVDSSEEMRDREEQNLKLLHKSNRVTAAAVSHELKNLCGAISLVCSQVENRHALEQDDDFQGLANLVKGLERMANLQLRARAGDIAELEEVPLRRVLDDLRIVIESEWTGIDGTVHWRLPEELPSVVADPHGLLQAFLNLAQNSHRAVQESEVRELDITVRVEDGKALTKFGDSGPGVASPEQLFQPFQYAADGTGLGLYVSRALVRSYGGDIRFEPRANGACFVVELQMA
jgi:C4-dicarboxylate-specific signal transduction histidine kinase